MPLFNGYVAVDWSAFATPTPVDAANSIWIAVYDANGMRELVNFRTRQAAMDHIGKLLNEANTKDRRLLIGFDFSFGYPVGTAQMLTRQEWLEGRLAADCQCHHGWPQKCKQQLQGGGRTECRVRRRRAVLGGAEEKRYPRPPDKHAAPRLGGEPAAKTTLRRTTGSEGETSLEALGPRISRKTGAHWDRKFGKAQAGSHRHPCLAVRDAW